MIGLSRITGAEGGTALAARVRATLSAPTVVHQIVWPSERPRLVLDGDWAVPDNLSLGVELRAEVGPTASGPWTLWAAVTTPPGRTWEATESPWINAPAPEPGTHVRVVVEPLGGSSAVGMVCRGGGLMTRTGL